MQSLKFAHLVQERTGATVHNFYIDMRTPGKTYEEFYNKLLEEGVHFIRGRVAEVTDWAIKPEENGKLIIRVEDTPEDPILQAVIRAVAAEEGATPVAWYPPGEAISCIDLTNISLKSISLLVGDKPDHARLNDPRFIVDQTNAFAIIPVMFSVHTIVSWDFAVTKTPGWHSTILVPSSWLERSTQRLSGGDDHVPDTLDHAEYEILYA
jgi:hypothetical protein